MIFAFAFIYHIFPARATPLTAPSDPSYTVDLLYHMVLPLMTIVLVGFGSWAYIVSYFVVGILGEDYIIAKRVAGIPQKRILYSHALKNAGPPIITVVALSLASFFWWCHYSRSSFWLAWHGKLILSGDRLLRYPCHNWIDVYFDAHFHCHCISHGYRLRIL